MAEDLATVVHRNIHYMLQVKILNLFVFSDLCLYFMARIMVFISHTSVTVLNNIPLNVIYFSEGKTSVWQILKSWYWKRRTQAMVGMSSIKNIKCILGNMKCKFSNKHTALYSMYIISLSCQWKPVYTFFSACINKILPEDK